MSIDRIGSIKDYTPNFKLIIPRFDLATWHDYIEENFRNIDALFFNLFGINNYSGPWKQITSYKEGQVLFIPDDRDINGEETIYSGRLVKVLVDHVTDNSDYFNVFYNLHPEYYELFADAGAAQIFAQQAQDASKEAKNSENVVIQKQNEINNTISEFNDNIVTKTEELSQQIAEGIEVIEQNTQIAVDNAEKSRIFAIGEQEEVETLAPDMLSSRGFANLSMAIANADEDVPIDASNLIALDIIKGPKGDKGDPGEPGKDGIQGELNNPFSLLDYKWSEYELNNASWLLSNGAFHSGTVYVAVYELLLKIYNETETKDGVSVKLSTEDYIDTDFVINTVDTTFRLPVKVKLASGSAVVGNGMTLGLTDGTNNGAFYETSDGYYSVNVSVQGYNQPIGTSIISGADFNNHKYIGVTTDATKSGIETSSSGLKLYFYVGETIQDANVINVGKALEIITSLANADYVVESKIATEEDPTWYRVYKSGWVEQGGKIPHQNTSNDVSVVFCKEMLDTNYVFNGCCVYSSNAGTDHRESTNELASKTTTGFTKYIWTNWQDFCWEVKGQGAK